MARHVTITGTRSAATEPVPGLVELFDAYLRPFASQDTHFYLGGAVGIDSMALLWLAEYTSATITVVVPCTAADQPDVAADAIQRAHQQGRLAAVVELQAAVLGTHAYHARNRWMVDRSDLVVGFPRGEEVGSGTWYTLDYAAELNKPRMIVPLVPVDDGLLGS